MGEKRTLKQIEQAKQDNEGITVCQQIILMLRGL